MKTLGKSDDGNGETGGSDGDHTGMGCAVMVLLLFASPYILALGLALFVIIAIPILAIALLAFPALMIFGALDA